MKPMDKPNRYLGTSVARVEDGRFLSGAGHFTDDHAPPGTVWGVVVRSPVANGTIRRLDVGEAAGAPGVLAVLTGADALADGLGTLEPDKALPRPDGGPMRVPPRPVLARERVRYVGDPVAFVVAETLDAAKDAAELVDIDIDTLPSVTELEAVRDGTAPPIDPDWPDNLAFHFEKGDAGAVDDAFARARHVTRLSLRISRVQPTPLEPRAALGEWSGETGGYTLHTPSQAPWRIRKTLARDILHVPVDTLRVVSPDMGGGFGNRSTTTPEQALVLWAARRLDRPVKWRADRTETFQSDDQGRHSLVDAALALDAQGGFLGLKVRTLYGVGAYHSQMSVGPATNNIGVLAGVYRIPAIHVAVDGAMLNVNPAAAYRGAGRPESSYIVERLVDAAARETGRDPAVLRRANMIPAEAMPYKTALTYTYDSGNFPAVLDRALALADRDGFPERRAESEARARRRGFGIACSIESAGNPSRGEQARLTMRDDGTVELAIGTHSHGQGHETAFRQVLADALGLTLDAIDYVQGDTDRLARGGGTAGSRSSAVGGGVATLAAERLIDNARPLAADALEASALDVTFEAGLFRVAGTDRTLDWSALARFAAARDALSALDIAESYQVAKSAFPNSCAIAEVEVDPETGAVALVGYATVGDYGTVLNPMLLEGQIHGGVAQGAGQILMEEMRWDPRSGQLLSGSFMDYAMPRASDMPSFRFASLPTPTDANLIGAKGAGEAGCVASLPAVMNAVVDALAPLGVRHIDMPVTPQRIWAALQPR